MNFRRYLFDRVPLLLLLFILLLVSFVYLVLHRIPGRIVLPLFLLWILFFGVLLYVGIILICACTILCVLMWLIPRYFYTPASLSVFFF